MPEQISVVVTSISAPNGVLRELATGARRHGSRFYVIGDVPSPRDFSIEGCDFYDLDRQRKTGLRFAELCPTRSYARKNIGYLLAMQDGADRIIETDDDNYPRSSFWQWRERERKVPVVKQPGWVNVYAFFSDANVWPRGLPLDEVLSKAPKLNDLDIETVDAPIQQGLADENPDVDAIYRLILPLPLQFKPDIQVALGAGVWCPFNSQNTLWWQEAYPLLYLPAYCSIRMTDIWRGFVAQRIAWENGWNLVFESPTVWQDRNDHNLMRDFSDEVPGYLHNRAICEGLEKLNLKPGAEAMGDNLRACYEFLVRDSFVGKNELALLDGWLADIQAIDRTEGVKAFSAAPTL